MKKKGIQFTAFLLAITLLLCTVTTNRVSAQSVKRIGVVTHNAVRVRDNAGVDGTTVLGQLNSGTMVTVLDQTTVGSVVWYKINCNVESGNVTGWSSGEYIKVRDVVLDGTYEDYLASQGFPQSYWESLSTLHAMYPNWQCIAVETGLEWADVVSGETQLGKKLTSRYNPDYYIDWTDVDANGNLIGRDGYEWVQASSNIIQYYLDPRNFLSDPYIFMFESQSYDVENHTIEGVENIIGNTFMRADNVFEADGATYTHAQVIMEAAKLSGVSPLHLASRLRQEQGTTGSSLSSGTVSGYEGYYNYFNYGAYPTAEHTTLVNGALYAKNISDTYFGPWTNPLRAIKGGAKLLGQNYINVGQDTVYFQCFNVVNKSSLYSHQYMTNVQAGESESKQLRKAYSTEELQAASLVFKIPVYNNMPEEPCTKQGSTSSQPSTPPVTPDPPAQPDTPVQPEPIPDPTVANGKYYYFVNGRVSAINEQASVSEFLSKTGLKNGTIQIFTASGSNKTSGSMKTGDVVKIYRTDGTEYASYTVVIWGDVTGDGAISLADLLKVKRLIVGAAGLSGWYYTAGDINGDGSVGLADLLRLKQHIVGKKRITQTR